MPEQKTSQVCIVTVTGKDRVGIIARLATTMAKANINIVDVNQKIMEDYFVMTMAADIGQATMDMGQIKKQLDTGRPADGPQDHHPGRKHLQGNAQGLREV